MVVTFWAASSRRMPRLSHHWCFGNRSPLLWLSRWTILSNPVMFSTLLKVVTNVGCFLGQNNDIPVSVQSLEWFCLFVRRKAPFSVLRVSGNLLSEATYWFPMKNCPFCCLQVQLLLSWFWWKDVFFCAFDEHMHQSLVMAFLTDSLTVICKAGQQQSRTQDVLRWKVLINSGWWVFSFGRKWILYWQYQFWRDRVQNLWFFFAGDPFQPSLFVLWTIQSVLMTAVVVNGSSQWKLILTNLKTRCMIPVFWHLCHVKLPTAFSSRWSW